MGIASIKKPRKVPTVQKLASEIAKREAGKSSVKIGDVREVLRIMIDIEAEKMVAEKLNDTWGTIPSDIINEHAAKKYKEITKKALKAAVTKQ